MNIHQPLVLFLLAGRDNMIIFYRTIKAHHIHCPSFATSVLMFQILGTRDDIHLYDLIQLKRPATNQCIALLQSLFWGNYRKKHVTLHHIE